MLSYHTHKIMILSRILGKSTKKRRKSRFTNKVSIIAQYLTLHLAKTSIIWADSKPRYRLIIY